MAGEQLTKMLTKRSGSDSEYLDVVYGRVTSVSPLRVQISNSTIIDDNFTVLGRYTGSFSVSDSLMATEEKKGKDGEKPKTEKAIRPAIFTFDNSLRVGDRVTMIRADGG